MIKNTKRGWGFNLSKIYPVFLAGGAGTRLWPLSRKSYPKQFSKLLGEKTLFQSSAERLTSSDLIEFAPHITLTNFDFRFIVGEQLLEVGIDPGPILIEPQAKNTAAAILAASIFSYSKDENAILFVAPTDHLIPDTHYFHEAINAGLPHVLRGKIVTFGISPAHPETGYGYLKISTDKLDPAGTSVVEKFVEKPDADRAKMIFNDGNYLWNAGIFLFRAQDMIEAFSVFEPDILDLVSKSVDNSFPDLGFLRLAKEPWSMLKDISIDYAVMEKAHNLVAVPYSSRWSDLGGWEAVWAENKPDENGNVTTDTAHAIDCTNSLLRSESDNQHIVGLGLDSIIVISMPDAVLVASKERSQDVKKAVELLITKDIAQAEIFPKDYRPWGWFENLALGDRFQVKRIYVKPGGALSLQSHSYRSEHWIVVQGTAKVTIDNVAKVVSEGESIYVPLGAIHRLENTSQLPTTLIEVQLGSYLGEDDIVRYEDLYKRGN